MLGAFARLGVTSFGGPIAHVGHFRREFVERRRWLDDRRFSQLLAISQFLPGPASSQLGFSIGLLRAGWSGALAAFVAFTLPSVVLLSLLASSAAWLGSPLAVAATHGLKLTATAVVAHGVVRMATQLTPDLPRAGIAVAALVAMLVTQVAWMQLAVIAGGALLGAAVLRTAPREDGTALDVRHGRGPALAAIGLFVILLAFALWWPTRAPVLGGIWTSFYRAGALVFGGGHVVLPLLQESVVATGWVTTDAFLTGYGAAQAVPGPMFSVAAFLGAQVPTGGSPVLGGLTAVLAIFLPGFLLVIAVLPVWTQLTASPRAARAVAGVNAAVVGLLAAAWYDPVWTGGVRGPTDLAIAAVGFGLVSQERLSALWTVGWCVAASVGLAYINVS